MNRIESAAAAATAGLSPLEPVVAAEPVACGNFVAVTGGGVEGARDTAGDVSFIGERVASGDELIGLRAELLSR